MTTTDITLITCRAPGAVRLDPHPPSASSPCPSSPGTSSSESTGPVVSPKELTRALADLHAMRPGPGLFRIAFGLAVAAIPFTLAWQAESRIAFVGYAVFAALWLGSVLITTHDAIHHTLTGWAWFDELMPRLLSVPILWPHGTYAELHKLHHKMNGVDPNDPERAQWTDVEYENAGPFGRFLARHHFALAVFVYGGVGLIISQLRSAIRFYPRSKGVRFQLWLDLGLMVVFNGAMYAYMASLGQSWKYVLLWVVLERVGGGMLQFRGNILHFGLWGKHANFFETQIFNSRNIRTNPLVSWYFVHLNFHSVHHSFPTIPFYNLAEAHRRVKALYAGRRMEIHEDEGYLRTAWRLMSELNLARTRP